MNSFDLIVLGGGPAGYLAGERAGQAGLTAAVIEGNSLGGVCLNEGCIPSKTLLNSAKLYEHAKDSAVFGVTAENVKIDHQAVIARKDRVVKTLVSGVQAKLKRHNVQVFSGYGKVIGRDDNGFNVEVNGERLQGKKLIIATGSQPVIPPITGMKEGIDDGYIVTSREILSLEKPPKHLVVIGGGVIGMEMASYYNSIGCQVTVVEMLEQVGGPLDEDIAEILLREYKKQGITFALGSQVTKVDASGVTYQKDGQDHEVDADLVLVSVGRKPHIKDLGLEALGVHIEKGGIVTDENMRTNIAGVYAAGDVNGRSMLAHTAYREAEVAINHILGKVDRMRYSAIPSVIYTTPEVAVVGESESSAREKGLDIEVVQLPMSYSGRYLAEVEGGRGICKLIASKEHGNLLGVHLIGSYVSEIIYGASMMIEQEIKIENLKEFIFPHPTVSEIIRETLFEL